MTLKDAIRNPCEPTREPNDVEGCNKQSVLATVFWPDGTPLVWTSTLQLLTLVTLHVQSDILHTGTVAPFLQGFFYLSLVIHSVFQYLNVGCRIPAHQFLITGPPEVLSALCALGAEEEVG